MQIVCKHCGCGAGDIRMKLKGIVFICQVCGKPSKYKV